MYSCTHTHQRSHLITAPHPNIKLVQEMVDFHNFFPSPKVQMLKQLIPVQSALFIACLKSSFTHLLSILKKNPQKNVNIICAAMTLLTILDNDFSIRYKNQKMLQKRGRIHSNASPHSTHHARLVH